MYNEYRQKEYTQEEVCLMNQLREVWEQHVYWTRFLISSVAADLGDIGPVTERLLENPKDLAEILSPFYGFELAEELQELFAEHLLIAGDLVIAEKEQEAKKVKMLRRQWYRNAQEIAEFLSKINPCWDEMKWKELLFSYLEMTEDEATLILAEDYAAGIQIFDKIEKEALEMADYMFCGISKQLDGEMQSLACMIEDHPGCFK